MQKTDSNKQGLFEPFRAFGFYTSDLPICVYKSGNDTLIASAVGKHAFYVYNTSKLNLVFTSKFISEEITYLQASSNGLIYTALTSQTNSDKDDSSEVYNIVAWNKMHKHCSYK